MPVRFTYFLLFLLTSTVSAYPEPWNTLQSPQCYQVGMNKQGNLVSTTQVVIEQGVGIALEVVGDSDSNFPLSVHCRNHVNYIQLSHFSIEGNKILCKFLTRFCDKNNTWIERKSSENLWILMLTKILKIDDPGFETYGATNESDLNTYPGILHFDDGPATVSTVKSRLDTLLFLLLCLAKVLKSTLRFNLIPTRNVQN